MEKTILITGASAGIGEAVAYKFAENGWNIIATARRNDRLELLKDSIFKKYNNEITTLCFDVRNRKDVEEQLNSLNINDNPIDLLVNNAGLSLGLDDFNEASVEEWDTMIDTNVKGLLYVSKFISKYMVKLQKGHIINIGSISGYNVYPKGHVYCASKFAVRAISEGMREDLAQHKIKVSSLNPGMIDTEFSIVRFRGDTKKASQVYNGFEPLHSEDIADTIFYMANTPEHVNLSEVIILPKAQSNAYFTHKEL